jgi:hypothetical protein
MKRSNDPNPSPKPALRSWLSDENKGRLCHVHPWEFGFWSFAGAWILVFGAFTMNFLTELKEGLSISWSAIRANKLRSTLTTLGIVIGIVTVTLMGTAIEGLNRAFLKSISFIGTDVLYVQRFNWFNHSYEDWMKKKKFNIKSAIPTASTSSAQLRSTFIPAVLPSARAAFFHLPKPRADALFALSAHRLPRIFSRANPRSATKS